MEPTLQLIKCNMGVDTRSETMDGIEYLVAPCIMINEGVHNGSQGALYYPSDELKRTVEAWNHKPVLLDHPKTNEGMPAKSTDKDVLERQKVGFLLNTEFVENKLRTEIWLDKKKANKVNPKIVSNLSSGSMMEVSTGLFTDDEKVENAEWNGEKYISRTFNYRPDHLAILLNAKGACSVADGAGFPRQNQEGDSPIENEEDGFFKWLAGKLNPFREKDITVSNASDDEAQPNTGDDTMTRTETINSIVANEASPFGESQREVLEGLDDAQLAVIAGGSIVNEEPEEEIEEVEEPKVENTEDVLDRLDSETRESIQVGLKLHKEKKASLIETITSCKTNQFKKEQLEGMEFSILENMASLVQPPADYSGQGPVPKTVDNSATAEPLPEPVYNWGETE